MKKIVFKQGTSKKYFDLSNGFYIDPSAVFSLNNWDILKKIISFLKEKKKVNVDSTFDIEGKKLFLKQKKAFNKPILVYY